MYCGNCGGEITDKDAYCPCCGVMNPRAAETEYMEKLEDIRENTERLGDEGGRHTKKEIRRVGKFAAIVFIIAAVFVTGLFTFSWAMDHVFFGSGRNARDEAAFKEKYFPKLEELYASGDMDATCDYMNELGGEDDYIRMTTYENYYRILDEATNDSRLGKKHTEVEQEIRALGFYYEAATLYKAYLAVDDSESAAQQKDRMERYKEEAGSYRSDTGNTDKMLGIE